MAILGRDHVVLALWAFHMRNYITNLLMLEVVGKIEPFDAVAFQLTPIALF